MSIIIRLQNLPWSANSLDIRRYFSGLSIPEGGVHIVGGEMGDAFIAFSTDEDARLAMAKDGGKIKDMQIKLLLSSRTEMMRVIEQARQQNMVVTQPHMTPQPPILSLQQPARIMTPTSEPERRRGHSPSPHRRSRDRSPARDRRRSPDDRRMSKRDRSRSPSRNNRSFSREMDRRSDRFRRDDRHYDDARYRDDRRSERDSVPESRRYPDADHVNSKSQLHVTEGFRNVASSYEQLNTAVPGMYPYGNQQTNVKSFPETYTHSNLGSHVPQAEQITSHKTQDFQPVGDQKYPTYQHDPASFHGSTFESSAKNVPASNVEQSVTKPRRRTRFEPEFVPTSVSSHFTPSDTKSSLQTQPEIPYSDARSLAGNYSETTTWPHEAINRTNNIWNEKNEARPSLSKNGDFLQVVPMDIDQSPSDISVEKETYHEALSHRGPQAPILNELSLRDDDLRRNNQNRGLPVSVDKGHLNQDRRPIIHGENRGLTVKDSESVSQIEKGGLPVSDRGLLSHKENRPLSMKDRGSMSLGENREHPIQERGPMSRGENREHPMQGRGLMTHSENREHPIQDRGPMTRGENREHIVHDRGPISLGGSRERSIHDRGPVSHGEGRERSMQDRGPMAHDENREHSMQDRGPMAHIENREHPVLDRGPISHAEIKEHPIQDRGPMPQTENRVHLVQDRGHLLRNDRILPMQDRGPRSQSENRGSPAQDRSSMPHNDGRRSSVFSNSPEQIPASLTVEVRGLPPDARIDDILDLFRGIPLPAANIRIEANNIGLEKAFIRFVSVADFEEALRRNQQFIQEGRCELIPCPAIAFDSAPHSQKTRPKLKPREEDLTVQLRGLPFSCKEDDIVNFFDGLGILDLFIETAPDGRASGTGFVEFGTPEDFRAALTMNGKMIGHRYITISIASKEMLSFARGEDYNPEPHPVSQFSNNSHSLNTTTSPGRPLPNQIRPPGPPLNQGRQGAPPVQNRPSPPPCISMKNLPEGVTNRDIADFLGQINVMPRAVHIMLRPDKTPSGDAFAEFGSLVDMEATLQLNGKSMRGSRVLVHPISFHEMSEILGRPSLMPPPPAPSALLRTPDDIDRPRRPPPGDVERPRRPLPGDVERPRRPPPGDIERPHRPPPGDIERPRRPPPGDIERPHRPPPGDIERPRRPPPGDIERPHRPPPGDIERPRRPLLPRGPSEVAFRERPRMEPPMRPPGPARMRGPWPSGGPRPEGRFPPPPVERGLKDFGAPGCVVSINNLHFRAGLEELLDFFSDYRITEDSVMRKYNENGQTTGEARVAFQNPRDAQRAVRELNHKPIMGRSLYLSIL